MSGKRRKYSREFKEEAMNLAEQVGVVKAAEELGIHHDNIRRWLKAQNGSKQKSIPQASQSALEEENRRLRKEIKYLKQINEVLKKSTAIFSKDHIGDSK